MTAAALLAELRAVGIVLAVDGDRLVARGRRLPLDLADRLRPLKGELVALLRPSGRPQYPQNASGQATAGNIADSADDSGGPAPTETAAGSVLATLAALSETAGSGTAEALADTALAVTRALAAGGPGWVMVWSRVLGAEVLFTRDADVDAPAEYADLPRFDRDELAVIAEQRPSPDRLRAICDVKREIPGTRVVQDTGETLTPARDVFPAAAPTAAAEAEEAQGDLARLTRPSDGHVRSRAATARRRNTL